MFVLGAGEPPLIGLGYPETSPPVGIFPAHVIVELFGTGERFAALVVRGEEPEADASAPAYGMKFELLIGWS